jgi:hypothetical protein
VDYCKFVTTTAIIYFIKNSAGNDLGVKDATMFMMNFYVILFYTCSPFPNSYYMTVQKSFEKAHTRHTDDENS